MGLPADDWRPSAARLTLEKRGQLLADLREFMGERGVLEIDTPVIASGVIPERDLQNLSTVTGDYLVSSPEASLKRALAAGLNDVYSLGHVFRSDEAGRWHSPEFCILEWYRRGLDLEAIIGETSVLLSQILGKPVAAPRTFVDVFTKIVGLDPFSANTSSLAHAAHDLGVAPDASTDSNDRAMWIDCLMSLVVQPVLGAEQPVCVTHFPIGDGSLVAPAKDKRTALRFEIYYHGVELANGAEELTDPDLAKRRMRFHTLGTTVPSSAIDQKLLSAMQHGVPACAGVALGVDRLLALQLGHHKISSVMPFAWKRR